MSTAPPPPSGEEPPLPDGAADDGAPDERARPRHRRLTILAVATAVLLAGGGGAYWASNPGSDSDPAASDQPPKLVLDGYGTQEDSQPASQRSSARGPQYQAVGELPQDGPDSAPLYRVSGPVSEDTVRELAEALDVPGAPRSQDGGWRAGGTKDGAGPVLRIRDQAPHTWTYAKLGETVRPGDHPTSNQDASPSTAHQRAEPSAPKDAGPDARAVSEERAKQAAEPVLEALGLSDAPVDAERTLGAVRLVTVDPRYGNLPTEGWQTVLQIGADGEVVRASGKLVTAEEGPRYPILSAEEALKKLNERGNAFTPPPCAEQSAALSPDTAVQQDAQPEPDGPPRLLPCGTSETVRVTDAELGLASHTSEGEPVLVPSWLFELKAASDGTERTVAYPAVEPEYLMLTTASSGVDRSAPPENREGGEGTQPEEGTERPEPDTSSQQVEQYSADDRTLTLHFWGGVCSDFTGVAKESDEQVRVSVEARPSKGENTHCIALAKRQSVTVELREPVGERTVVGHDGEPLPEKEKQKEKVK